jgi:hypothetical protein
MGNYENELLLCCATKRIKKLSRKIKISLWFRSVIKFPVHPWQIIIKKKFNKSKRRRSIFHYLFFFFNSGIHLASWGHKRSCVAPLARLALWYFTRTLALTNIFCFHFTSLHFTLVLVFPLFRNYLIRKRKGEMDCNSNNKPN